jgi:hypothetical protein
MPTIAIPELYEFTDTVPYRPAISILLSLEQMSYAKERIKQSVKQATEEVERHLLEHYPGEMVLLMKEKLRQLIGSINYNSNKKSVALYLSPLFEKILYLDIPVMETATVDESFDIRDIVSNKKQSKEYLVLHITENEYRIYQGKEQALRLILHNSSSAHHAAYKDLLNEISANNHGKKTVKELMQEHFLKHAANTLDILQNAYHLPVFVVGQMQVIDYFQKITHQTAAIVDLLCTHQDITDKETIAEILKPYILDWKKVKYIILKNQLSEAAGKQKLTTGIKAVWQEASAHKGKLLIVEKNFIYPAEQSTGSSQLSSTTRYYPPSCCTTNLVDDIIEKILESGGDVEFVEDGYLEDCDRIALIKAIKG